MQKTHAMLLLAALSAGSGPLSVRAATPKVDALYPYIQDIEQAAEPAEVALIYKVAIQQDRKHVPLREAYLRRMLALGGVDGLGGEADVLLDLDPNNGLAWAVRAFHQAERGAMTDAFASLVRAVRDRPKEPFIADLAGQFVAWYDLQRDKAALPEAMREAVACFRREVGGRMEFAQGYQDANRELTRLPAARTGAGAGRGAAAQPPRSTAPPPPAAPPDEGRTVYVHHHYDVVLVPCPPRYGRHGLARRIGVMLRPDGSRVVLTPQHPIGGVVVAPGAVPAAGALRRPTAWRPAFPAGPPPEQAQQGTQPPVQPWVSGSRTGLPAACASPTGRTVSPQPTPAPPAIWSLRLPLQPGVTGSRLAAVPR
jgi:hypothetical protein